MSLTNWICDPFAPSGYGTAARADMRALIKAGIEPRIIEHQHDTNRLDLNKDEFWKDRIKPLLGPGGGHPSVVVWQETPEYYRPDPTSANVARIEWETSRIIDYDMHGNPAFNWVRQLSQMTEIWPASQFVADVLKDCGVTSPMVVIPHPTDLEAFSPGDRTEIGGGKPINPEDRFTVLSAFQWTTRKNPHALLTAWSRSKLGRQKDACLLVKSYHGTFSEAGELTQEIINFRSAMNIQGMKSNVFPITWKVEAGEMPNMYRGADVFLTTTRGEGFGLPMAEAMACGLPVIYTDATAHAEFCHGYPVRCRREPVYGMGHIPWYSTEHDWWSIDVLHLVERLEEAYEDWKSGRLKELGAEARAKAEELHSDERVGRLLKERVLDLSKRFAPREVPSVPKERVPRIEPEHRSATEPVEGHGQEETTDATP